MIAINQNDKLKNVLKNRIIEIIDPYYISDPELYEIYKKSIPPPEAFYYFPKGEEIMITNDKKPEKALRRIFLNVPYTEIEKRWIKEFKEEIQTNPEIVLPDYWNDSYNLRFVYATECNIKKSHERLARYLKWHRNLFPMTIQPGDKVVELLNLGFLYVYGRDHQFRPILVCQPYVYQKNMNLFREEEVIRASVFLITDYLLNNSFILPKKEKPTTMRRTSWQFGQAYGYGPSYRQSSACKLTWYFLFMQRRQTGFPKSL